MHLPRWGTQKAAGRPLSRVGKEQELRFHPSAHSHLLSLSIQAVRCLQGARRVFQTKSGPVALGRCPGAGYLEEEEVAWRRAMGGHELASSLVGGAREGAGIGP